MLGALRVSLSERVYFYSLLPSKRGESALRALAQAPESNVTVGSLPSDGEMWRMLRERRGLTGSAWADRAGVKAYQITRWEKGDGPVPMERRPELLAQLGALPEEEEALLKDSPPGPPLVGANLDGCAAAVAALEERLRTPPAASGHRPVTNLDFLVLQRALWRVALAQPSALELFRHTLALHSAWLDGQSRRKEMTGPVDRLFALMEGVELARLPGSQEWWTYAVLHRVRVWRFANQEGRSDEQRDEENRRSLRLLETYLGAARGVQRCTLHRDIAGIWASLHEFKAAFAHINEAKALADRYDETGWSPLWCAKSEADTWVAAGDPEHALRIAPPIEQVQQLPEQRAHLYGLWADLLARVGNDREAQNYLDAGRALVQGRLGPSHLLRLFDAIAARL